MSSLTDEQQPYEYSKGYLIPYTADERQLVKVGVSFDAGERNVGEWKVVGL
ncbi:hypothetical protein [Parabacteroides sp. AF17-28]|uniref:hypothetical protein n=1 Tax=Parabacteroides sp. AF17-28 TaxID=2292241 RepID=UPI001313F21D|nr:hypothetical protein [Parabacteroides sp. AF17-28]